MSRIFDASWIKEIIRAYWKRSAASATAFAHRYRNDLFLRTEVNIIVLQFAYAALILLLSIGGIIILYQEITSRVVAMVATALTTATPLSGEAFLQPLEAARSRNILSIATLIFAATALFGYLVARLALAPARNSLAAQKQFIGNIAHELRTPLAIIKTNTEVMLMEKHADHRLKKTFQSNIEELDRISNIINNLLSLNALLRPEKMSFADVDMAEVIRRVCEKVSPALRQKSVRLKIAVVPGSVVWGNEAALEQIVTNLLKNAVQYTSAGEIVVTTARVPDARSLEVSITDTGVGIKRDDLHRIFEPFYRGDRARTRSGETGSGLGLSIVSELVKVHQGRVTIRSAPGRGTTVVVALPASRRATELPAVSEGGGVNEVFADFSAGKGMFL